MADQTTAEDIRPLASVEEVSAYLGVPVQTLYHWRHRKQGPASSRIGKHLRYRWSDVDAYVNAQQTS